MRSTSAQILFAGNDAIVELRGLANSMTGDPINDAAVSCTLLDSAGDEVAGEVWPLDMQYLEESGGIYRVTLAADLGLVAAARYTLRVDADGGAGLVGRWDLPCICMTRT